MNINCGIIFNLPSTFFCILESSDLPIYLFKKTFGISASVDSQCQQEMTVFHGFIYKLS